MIESSKNQSHGHGNSGVILRINQTKAIFPSEFEVIADGAVIYRGQYSRVFSFDYEHILTDRQGSLIYKTQAQPHEHIFRIIPFNLIPFYWIIRPQSRVCSVIDNFGEPKAEFMRHREGLFGNTYYMIQYNSMNLKLYCVGAGKNKYILVFLDDKQIGQICKENIVRNNLDWYMLFLLEAYRDIAPILSLFTLYYDGYHHPSKVQKGFSYETSWSWSFDMNRAHYDSTWLHENFENTNPF